MTQQVAAQNNVNIPGLVSILLPVYNEEESIPKCYEELTSVLGKWGGNYELLFVNDGSKDRSLHLLRNIAAGDRHVRVINFRKNFGQTAAITAAIDCARGNVLIPMDADLQNDPADVPALLAKLDEGYDVVSGWRRDRKDKAFTRVLPSKMANWLISMVSGVKLHDYGCSLKAYRREVVDGMRLYGEMHRFIPIYAKMNGGSVTELVVNHRPRIHGKSKYGLERVIKVVLDLFVVKFLLSFASKPIYVFGGFGLACIFSSLIPAGAAIFYKLASGDLHKDFVETPLPILSATLVLVGVLAILQGLLAEVLMRTYFESQSRRPYVIAETLGLQADDHR